MFESSIFQKKQCIAQPNDMFYNTIGVSCSSRARLGGMNEKALARLELRSLQRGMARALLLTDRSFHLVKKKKVGAG